jgi:hypothetical protein
VLIYDLIVQTYEEGNPVPVVTHIFHGKSAKQARGFYQAHLKADAFLRGCRRGHFADFKCRNKVLPMRTREVPG